ncbi:MAG: hypothetical protein ACOZQL_00910 [Myxococcota bacterium]
MTLRLDVNSTLASTLEAATDDCAVKEVLRTPQLTVAAQRPLTPTEARTLTGRVARAMKFGDELQRWDDGAALRARLTAVVLSDRCLARETGAPAEQVPGVTTGPNEILLRRASLARRSSVDAEVLAHELAHVQDLRMAGRREGQLPLYLQEGKAYVIGVRYAATPQRLRQLGDDLAQLTPEQARWVVQEFRSEHPQGNPNLSYLGEVAGALFVEYLSAHVKRDALVRLGDAIEATGDGARFTDEFERRFGLSLAAAEARFVAFIAETADDPRRRLAGTIFAGR